MDKGFLKQKNKHHKENEITVKRKTYWTKVILQETLKKQGKLFTELLVFTVLLEILV